MCGKRFRMTDDDPGNVLRRLIVAPSRVSTSAGDQSAMASSAHRLLPRPRPGFAHEELRIRALARGVLLDSTGPHFSGVEIALFVGREPVHAPLAALARAERSP